ncbi:MAG: sigma-54-dependent Fis family transcriptional regulator [Acidobacteria bacterium]|nr:MAG: sigma-54-dependent Fis family transcriptional regulator [Acidobacteriota bacterium]
MRLLILDDEALFLETLARIFGREGFEVTTTSVGSAAIQHIERNPVDVVLADVVMPGMDGLTFLEHVRSRPDPPEVVMLTAHATVETAVRAMKAGAYDYLQKPARVEEIEKVVQRAYEHRRLMLENRRLARMLDRVDPYRDLVGDSPKIRELRELIERVAPTETTVLITGESGTGKELVARKIHAASPRADGPFLAVNCGSLRPELLENELFGHVAGAFTGATRSAAGLFEEADGGTLLIDEIGEMELGIQPSLLRVLETGEFKRLGQPKPRRTNARVLAATNRDLARDVEAGRFRRDLFYRLNVFTIHVPPLRERREDIPALAEHFLRWLEPERPEPRRLTPRALEALRAHDWPGNVRELRNAIERGLIMARGDTIDVGDLPPLRPGSAAPAPEAPRRPAPPAVREGAGDGEFLPLAELEARQIREALERTGGNKTAAARLLGISLRSLYTKLARHGIESTPGT